MSDTARDRIFDRLRKAVPPAAQAFPSPELPPKTPLNHEEKLEKLKRLMEAVRSEVHVVPAATWTDELKTVLRKRNLKTLLYAPETYVGKAVTKAWQEDREGLPSLTLYEGEIETFKETLFYRTDAAITTTRGAIADPGTLILWPDETEPRLMSLIPPIHIAVLEAGRIYNTFDEAMQAGQWISGMPTNAVLISGPSKTADIELTLAFGVHGPRELILFVLE